MENISRCKLLSFDAPVSGLGVCVCVWEGVVCLCLHCVQEWQRITGGAKDLLSRMLVRATQVGVLVCML